MTTMQNKRKRESHDVASARAAPGMNQTGDEFEQHYLETDDDIMDNSNFAAALAHHDAENAERQDSAQTGNGQSTSDTAAAAMAQYHTMTVPQSTEQSFMTQKTPGGIDGSGAGGPGDSSAQRRTSSFGDYGAGITQSSPNGDGSPTGASASNPFGPKPTVGSDEWHKVRRDNHKEGKSGLQNVCITRYGV